MNPKVKAIFDEMCLYVGTTYDGCVSTPDGDGKHHWPYDSYTWSSAAELCFKGWLMEQLKKRSVMRALSGSSFSTNKRRRELTANMFLLNYGWRTER